MPFFATVMGLSGLTLATHKVESLWGAPHGPATVLFVLTPGVFAQVAGLYALKALRTLAAVGRGEICTPEH